LVSPDFSAVPKFGQPVIQTSEPCGKRSLVGGRFVAASIFAVIRALRHAAETRNDAAVDESDAPSPSKAARTILSAPIQVKIASQPYSSLIFLVLFELPYVRCGPLAALQQPDPQYPEYVPDGPASILQGPEERFDRLEDLPSRINDPARHCHADNRR
jgi:hypothetical protein